MSRSGDSGKDYIAASDLAAELQGRPRHRAGRERRDAERASTLERNRLEAAPVLSELRNAGFQIDSLAELKQRDLDYHAAIPVLMDWLPRLKTNDVKAMVISALAIKWAKPSAAPLLIREFERADENAPGASLLRWSIGDALSVVSDDSVFDDIARLAQDVRYGYGRQMLALALANMGDPRTVDVLIGLLADEEMSGHAVTALGKLKAQTARSAVEPFLKHPKPWVRRAAKKALARMSGSAGPRQKRRKNSLSPEARAVLHEASSNFELDDIQPLLERVARLVGNTLSADDIAEAVLASEELNVNESASLDYVVKYKGIDVPLRIDVFMEDVDSPDLRFLGPKDLVEKIGLEIIRFQTEQER